MGGPDSIKRDTDCPGPAMVVRRVSEAQQPQTIVVVAMLTWPLMCMQAGPMQRDMHLTGLGGCVQSPHVPGPSSDSASMATSWLAAV
jgi:hypothetical protein